MNKIALVFTFFTIFSICHTEAKVDKDTQKAAIMLQLLKDIEQRNLATEKLQESILQHQEGQSIPLIKAFFSTLKRIQDTIEKDSGSKFEDYDDTVEERRYKDVDEEDDAQSVAVRNKVSTYKSYTDKESTDKDSADNNSTHKYSTDKPSTEETSTDKTSTHKQSTEGTSTEKTSSHKPFTDKTSTDTTSSHKPTTEETTTDKTSTHKPSTDETSTEAPKSKRRGLLTILFDFIHDIVSKILKFFKKLIFKS
ncbi:hypothetical protein ILUMI_07103 [Ignelater luminosus]|uniref:Uncharacterized protein n=1 Tax=Ignelater luminosus TaxID=2038154 RepID=A0A8K0D430_IGNLU|nr:hypothetical protein ILUMI_07103 [Ignelater luminosus]